MDTIKQSYTNTVNELNQELAVLREQLDARADRLESKQAADEVVLSNDWEDVGMDLPSAQTPGDVLREALSDCVSVDFSGGFDGVVRQVGDEIRKERKERRELAERYNALEKVNYDLRLG